MQGWRDAGRELERDQVTLNAGWALTSLCLGPGLVQMDPHSLFIGEKVV